MSVNQYALNILFHSNHDVLFYEGPSFDKGREDQVNIRSGSITFHFQSAKKMDIHDLLYSARSRLRSQIQRALTFYLAIHGTIPPVRSIELHHNEHIEIVHHSHFTKTWSNCYTTKKFNAADLTPIFSDHPAGRMIYDVLTYWLKSKLDEFVHDQFRFLWSGFNAFYNYMDQLSQASASVKSSRESEKLRNFEKEVMQAIEFKETLNYLRTLPDEFYVDVIHWYKFIKSKNCNHWVGILSRYPDGIISQQIVKYASVAYSDETKLIHEMNQMAKKHAQVIDHFVRLKFLLIELLYFVRNQHFHAANHYQLFVITAPDQRLAEDYYCDILQHVLVDSIKSMKRISKSKSILSTQS